MRNRRFTILLALAGAFLALSPVRSLAAVAYTFTTVDYPDAGATWLAGINNRGEVAGVTQTGYTTRSFIWRNGGFTHTLSPERYERVILTDINDAGVAVGYTETLLGRGFVWRNGTLTYLPVSGNMELLPYGINAQDMISGYSWLDRNDDPNARGFTLAGNTLSTFQVPLTAVTVGKGNNDAGQVAGIYVGQEPETWSFLKTGGQYTRFAYPGAVWTLAEDVNNRGEVAGTVGIDGFGLAAFVWRDGAFETFRVPGSRATEAMGINDLGQVVGSYKDASNRDRGFIATPVNTAIPEPASLGLLLLGGAPVLLRRRR